MKYGTDTSLFYTSLEEINTLYLNAIDLLAKRQVSHGAVRDFYIKMHSLKGSSGLLGFQIHSKVAHGMESLLKSTLNGSINMTEEGINLINQGMELLNSSDIPDEESSRYTAAVRNWLESDFPSEEKRVEEESSYFLNMPEELYNSLSPKLRTLILTHYREGKNIYILRAFLRPEMVSETFGALGSLKEDGLSAISTFPIKGKDGLIGVGRVYISNATDRPDLEDRFSSLWEKGSWFQINAPFVSRRETEPALNLRIPLNRYEQLLNLIQDLHFNFRSIEEKNRLRETIREIYVSAREIGDMPVKPLLTQLLIYTKNIAIRSGKLVNVISRGANTEVSYTLHNSLKEILVVLLNNAVAHAVLPPEQRSAQGKSAEGNVEVSIERKETDILIKVIDDGEGLNEKKISENFSVANSSDLWEIVSAPSFTTKSDVDPLSGRGNGLAHVRDVVERLNGSVSIENNRGKGLSVEIQIPLSTTFVKIFPVFTGDETAALLTAEITEKSHERDFVDLNRIFPEGTSGHLEITLSNRRDLRASLKVDAVEPESRENVHILSSHLKDIIPIYGIFINLRNKRYTPILSALILSRLKSKMRRTKLFAIDNIEEEPIFLRRADTLVSLPIGMVKSIHDPGTVITCGIEMPHQLKGFLLHNGMVVPVFNLSSDRKDSMTVVLKFHNETFIAIGADEILSGLDIEDGRHSLIPIERETFLYSLEKSASHIRNFYRTLFFNGELHV